MMDWTATILSTSAIEDGVLSKFKVSNDLNLQMLMKKDQFTSNTRFLFFFFVVQELNMSTKDCTLMGQDMIHILS